MARHPGNRKAAKQARRRKRQSGRDAAWIPAPLFQEMAADDEHDAVADAVAEVDEWIVGRGWVLDAENSQDLVSWVYPPSAEEVGDDGIEPVTRIWITLKEGDDEVVLEFGAALVGVGGADRAGVYLLDPDTLADDIVALEAYRPGLTRPQFG